MENENKKQNQSYGGDGVKKGNSIVNDAQM
jgi:hypothetical protein